MEPALLDLVRTPALAHAVAKLRLKWISARMDELDERTKDIGR
jgi:hypothetical protein